MEIILVAILQSYGPETKHARGHVGQLWNYRYQHSSPNNLLDYRGPGCARPGVTSALGRYFRMHFWYYKAYTTLHIDTIGNITTAALAENSRSEQKSSNYGSECQSHRVSECQNVEMKVVQNVISMSETQCSRTARSCFSLIKKCKIFPQSHCRGMQAGRVGTLSDMVSHSSALDNPSRICQTDGN